MTPDRREELRRADDASFRTRLSLENERLQARADELEMRLCERILMSDLEISALKEAGLWNNYTGKPDSLYIVERIKAIESLLIDCDDEFMNILCFGEAPNALKLQKRIMAILPKAGEVK